MKIAVINHSDTAGGASVVSLRLTEALRRLGHDARMIVSDMRSGNPAVVAAGHPCAANSASWRSICVFSSGMASIARTFLKSRFAVTAYLYISIRMYSPRMLLS